MMVARNEFRAYRLVELTLLVLLLLSPLEETHAIDSTLKLRGKDNEESIDSSVIHVTAEESSSIGLTSDQSLSITVISDEPNGEFCILDSDCQSGRCSWDFICEDKLPNGESCSEHEDCQSDRCSSYTCQGKKENGESCTHWGECLSEYCTSPGKTCESPPPEDDSCFSSTSMVNHMSHGLVPISDINIGDYIQSHTDGSFSRVYAFEKNHDGKSEFLQIHSSTDTLLELTDRHMLYLKKKPVPIPAGRVRVGDVLETIEDSGAQVEKIEIIQREGYYAPHTEDGTIIVNNIMTSSYSTAKSSAPSFLYGDNKVLSFQNMVNIGLSPLRFTCKAVWFGFCSDERFQDENGFHMYIVFLDYFSGSPILIQLIFYPIIFGMGVMFSVLELMYDKAEALLEVASSTGAGTGLLVFSLVTALAVPGLFALRKRYFL